MKILLENSKHIISLLCKPHLNTLREVSYSLTFSCDPTQMAVAGLICCSQRLTILVRLCLYDSFTVSQFTSFHCELRRSHELAVSIRWLFVHAQKKTNQTNNNNNKQHYSPLTLDLYELGNGNGMLVVVLDHNQFQ